MALSKDDGRSTCLLVVLLSRLWQSLKATKDNHDTEQESKILVLGTIGIADWWARSARKRYRMIDP